MDCTEMDIELNGDIEEKYKSIANRRINESLHRRVLIHSECTVRSESLHEDEDFELTEFLQ